MSDAIVVQGLGKRYGEVVAVDGLNLVVPEGTVMGLLGPNGAGKTTTVRILTTLLKPDAGKATVAGLDVVAEAHQLREAIGLSGQYAAVDENLTGFENLDMVIDRLNYPLGVFVNIDSVRTQASHYIGPHRDRIHFFATRLIDGAVAIRHSFWDGGQLVER